MNKEFEVFVRTLVEKAVKEVLEELEKDGKLDLKQFMDEDQKILDMTYFSEKHTWAKVTKDWDVQIGLTEYALEHLKGLAHIHTDNLGDTVRRIEPFGVAETWMFMFDLYSPVAGKITKINTEVITDPTKTSAETWIVELHPIDRGALVAELRQLMTGEKYKEFIAQRTCKLKYPFPEL